MTNFNIFIAEFKAGRLNEMLTGQLSDLIDACERHVKAGTLTLKLTVKPTTQQGEVVISAKVDNKPPKFDTMDSTVFLTPEGNISANDPKQTELFSKNVVRPVGMQEQKVTQATEN